MPATVATPTGALNELMRSSFEFEPLGSTTFLSVYKSGVLATLRGNTYWRDVVLGARPQDLRPPSMFRAPSFSLTESGDFRRVVFHEIEDPDDIVW
jgi:hypothetical protein